MEYTARSLNSWGERPRRRSRRSEDGTRSRSRRMLLSALLAATGLALTQCAPGGDEEPDSGRDVRSSSARSTDGGGDRPSPRTTAPSADETTGRDGAARSTTPTAPPDGADSAPTSPEAERVPGPAEDPAVRPGDGGEGDGAPPALTDDPTTLLGTNVLRGEEFLQYSNAHGCYVGMYGHWLCDGGAVEIATDTGSDVTSVTVKNDHPMEPPLGVSWDDLPQDLLAKLGEPSTFHDNYFYVWDQPDGTRFSVTYNMQGSDPGVDYLPFEIAHFQVDHKPDWVSY